MTDVTDMSVGTGGEGWRRKVDRIGFGGMHYLPSMRSGAMKVTVPTKVLVCGMDDLSAPRLSPLSLSLSDPSGVVVALVALVVEGPPDDEDEDALASPAPAPEFRLLGRGERPFGKEPLELPGEELSCRVRVT